MTNKRLFLAVACRGKSNKRMINLNKYKEDFEKLGINNKDEQLEIINSLMRFAIIAQNNYNERYKNYEEERGASV